MVLLFIKFSGTIFFSVIKTGLKKELYIFLMLTEAKKCIYTITTAE